jgi:hypothetical protein
MTTATARGRGAMKAAVTWLAHEMIYVGQNIIRTAYQWLRWSEKL